MKYWEQLPDTLEFKTQTIELSKADIKEFASEFDPQPYHLDEAAADESIFGGLCASGWQVSAIALKQLSDSLADNQIPLLGIKDTSSLTWKRPAFVGDSLSCKIVLSSPEASANRLNCGTVTCEIEMSNHKQKIVMHMVSTLFIAQIPKEQVQ